jgi:hypothetical protein
VANLGEFDILGTTGGYLGSEDFIEFIDGAETGTLKRNLLEGKGPLAILLLVIVGGVLLNLTPCVLPLIPINLAIIGAGAQAGSRARGFALGRSAPSTAPSGSTRPSPFSSSCWPWPCST